MAQVAVMTASVVSTYLAPVQPGPAPAPVKSEAAIPQTPQPAQTDRPVTARPAQPDIVEISSQALDLNKTLDEQRNLAGAVQQERQRQQEQTVKEKSPYEAARKQYPPFMGDTEALRLLKQSAPMLYREVLKMIVPPPANLSYADRLLLEESKQSLKQVPLGSG